MDKIKHIDELSLKLNQAVLVYEQGYDEIMTNAEYDRLYDELYHLEIETGYVSKHSPTRKVGYEVVSQLDKIKHNKKMLSLDKTKDTNTLPDWLGGEKGLLSYKLDGLSLGLTYNEGILIKAITRGNGEIGEDVTHNAKVIQNLPKSISYKGRLTIRGEAVISYKTFNKINDKLADDQKYKNPRNLASGSIRQLDNKVTAKRGLEFIAFKIIDGAEELGFKNKFSQLDFLIDLGFDIVSSTIVSKDSVINDCLEFEKLAPNYPYPVDGLVLTYNDLEYSNSLPVTSKFPKHSIAIKWADEITTSTLRGIEWNTSRTGLINPVALFDPIDIDGTTVTRASVHNLTIMDNLKLHIGDEIGVIKANMIIPQIIENYSNGINGNTINIPAQCPSCNGKTEVRQTNDSKMLYCINDNCNAKLLGKLVHFCSRNAMNIEGLSEATLERLIQLNHIKSFVDIYRFPDDIVAMLSLSNTEGFGKTSVKNLVTSIEKSSDVELPNFIYAMGIENVGLNTSKLLCEHFKYDIEKIFYADNSEFENIEGIGKITSNNLYHYFRSSSSDDMLDLLNGYVKFTIHDTVNNNNQTLKNKSFVITGEMNHFKNRKELQSKIEELGGKVVGSVSKKTNYLINNDIHSPSSKNKKALELNIPILTEDDFLGIIGVQN